MQDEEYQQGMSRPVFQMTQLAIKNEVVTVGPEIGGTGLDLQRNELAGGLVVFDDLDLSIDTVVANRLLTEQPANSCRKIFSTALMPLRSFVGSGVNLASSMGTLFIIRSPPMTRYLASPDPRPVEFQIAEPDATPAAVAGPLLLHKTPQGLGRD